MRFSASTFNDLFIWNADIRQIFYYERHLARMDGAPWIPKGLVKLFFASAPPTPATMYALTTVAYVSTIAAMVGLMTRIAAPVSVLSVLLVSSIFTSWGAYWSHGFNVVHLAGLAFMFGRSGDKLSIDAAIARMFGRKLAPPSAHDGVYRWPVMAGELAVHLFLFGAFWSKMMNGGGIMWALSDNLRNSLAVTWGLYRSYPPLIIDIVITHLWAFRFIGLAQLFMQGVTIISCLLIRYPIWRALIGGLVLALEILGLGVLFEFWHWNWVPLIAFSIDWDRLAAWMGRRMGGGKAVAAMADTLVAPAAAAGWRGRLLGAYLGVFFIYNIANFVFQLGEKHLNYPFSSMAFFSENRALRPFRQSSDWSEMRGMVRVFVKGQEKPLDLAHIPAGLGELSRAQTADARRGAMQSIVATSNTGHAWCLSKEALAATSRWRPEYSNLRGDAYGAICGQVVAPESLQRVELRRTVSVVPARPEQPLPMRDVHEGLIGLHENGETATLGVSEHIDPQTRRWYVSVEPVGLDIETIDVLTRFNVNSNRHYRDLPGPQPVKGEWSGKSFVFDESEHGVKAYWTLIRVKDRRLGELLFWGPVVYPYVRGNDAVRLFGKPLGR